MKRGLINIGCATTNIKVADVQYNVEKIKEKVIEAVNNDIQFLVCQELGVTGYTCGDLFFQNTLLDASKDALIDLKHFSKDYDILFTVGLPFKLRQKIYNVGALIYNGKILGLQVKKYLPNYNEFYERRQFTPAPLENEYIELDGEQVLFGSKMVFVCQELQEFAIGLEICEDLWVPMSPSASHALNGATIIANLSASNEVVGKDNYRRMLLKGHSAKLLCAYAYASSGDGESTTDLVFGGHNLIVENGAILKESRLFENGLIKAQVDVIKLSNERAKSTTFVASNNEDYDIVYFSMPLKKNKILRKIKKFPFIPTSKGEYEKRCEDILTIQSQALKKRVEHTRAKSIVIGISGGLDSCLALLVMVRTMDLLKRSHQDIIAVTMPGFGTSNRTYQNALTLCEQLDVKLLNISIVDSVKQHLKDIDHDINVHDVTYENAQARERTQILMDISNKYNGFVVGTGDLSELALGWATYNGDHMSMYGVNGSIPKTLVRHLVKYEAHRLGGELERILIDVFETPVSPELLPPKDDKITQVTEDIVGPYELHDFFLYNLIRWGFTPTKVYDFACHAFKGMYSKEVIKKWLTIFVRRFFSQQFKRSCLPDGPKVGTLTLSPRGDFRMPSDALSSLWLKEIEEIK